MCRSFWLAVLGCAFLAPGLVAADEAAWWPQFLGPGGRAVQESGRPPRELSLEEGVRWQVALPPGHSSPCIWDDALFLTAYRAESKELETICIDRTSGDIRWRQARPDVGGD